MNLEVVTKAGLTPAEAAEIIGVSRVMVWKYSKGSVPTKKVTQQRCRTLELVLSKLIEKGALPKDELALHRGMGDELRARRTALVERITKLVDDRVAVTPANE